MRLHLDGGVGGVVHHSRGESVEAEESHHNLYCKKMSIERGLVGVSK